MYVYIYLVIFTLYLFYPRFTTAWVFYNVISFDDFQPSVIPFSLHLGIISHSCHGLFYFM